jgi:transposase
MPPNRRRFTLAKDRARREQRRLAAAGLFARGQRPAEVARQLGVSRQAATRWRAAWTSGGSQALHSKGPSGPAPRLSDQDLERVEQALLQGARAHGFTGDLWTLARIATVIERLTGVGLHPGYVWVVLRERLGWSVQRPRRHAAERDEAAIQRWVATDWPRIRQTPNDAKPDLSSAMNPA